MSALHNRQHNSDGDTPLAHLFNKLAQGVFAKRIPTTLQQAVTSFGSELDFTKDNILARCLRASGATALLLTKVNGNIICLIGRWRSDKMMRYLHI